MSDTILITGAAGMVGSHLFERLRREGRSVLGTYYRPTIDVDDVEDFKSFVELDVRYRSEVDRFLRAHKPGVIYHLAAQSLPVRSWISPDETMEVNAMGTINVFEAIKAIRLDEPAYDPVVVVACSSAEYGASLTPENVPIREEALLLPLHPYGVSKVAQDLLTYQYWVNDKVRGVRARIFNSTGPRKQGDVVSDFARRVAALGPSGGVLKVGNLTPQRAILDVQDLISALIGLAEKGEAGDVYNICSDHLYSVGDLIGHLEAAIDGELVVEVDQALLRPSDEPVIFGDNSKLRARTGWRQTVAIDETIRRVLAYEVDRAQRKAR
ncbi:MAG: GDP-mannose 4,6-dehydratase [Asticcacaulis sp.]|nr:GDP-mannose 4,6-dehydratase [Asticcacaulis sp.]